MRVGSNMKYHLVCVEINTIAPGLVNHPLRALGNVVRLIEEEAVLVNGSAGLFIQEVGNLFMG